MERGGGGFEAMIDPRQQAAEDLEDIAFLERNTNFNRYWLRHLKAKRAAMQASFENDSPEQCSHEEREIRRRILKTYDELLGMMAQHQATARAMVGT